MNSESEQPLVLVKCALGVRFPPNLLPALSAIPNRKMHPCVQNGRANTFGAKKIALNATKHKQQPLALTKFFVPVVLRYAFCAKLHLIPDLIALLSLIPYQRVMRNY